LFENTAFGFTIPLKDDQASLYELLYDSNEREERPTVYFRIKNDGVESRPTTDFSFRSDFDSNSFLIEYGVPDNKLKINI
jgi:hypothetical protein